MKEIRIRIYGGPIRVEIEFKIFMNLIFDCLQIVVACPLDAQSNGCRFQRLAKLVDFEHVGKCIAFHPQDAPVPLDEPLEAAEYSSDNVNWKVIPPEIRVLGSRFALVIEDLKQVDMMLPLDQTRVPVGPSTGRLGSKYIAGKVDKACLEILDAPVLLNDQEPKERKISLVATLRAPYAVFLRNFRT